MTADPGKYPPALRRILGAELLEQVPFSIAVIDRDFQIIAANKSFEEYFGAWRGKRCFEVYKGLFKQCPNCVALDTFQDGLVRVADSAGIDRHGRECHYVTHLAPIRDETGEIRYVMEMSTDLTETKRWQREYNLLFERVPCYITVIDRDYHIIRANEKFRQTFGDVSGAFCYQVYKRRQTPCTNCPAKLTFTDGAEHVSRQYGVDKNGNATNYIVTTSPLSRGEDGVAHVIEIATDITEEKRLQDELREAHNLYEGLIRNSAQGIVSVHVDGKVTSINQSARNIFGLKSGRMPQPSVISKLLPREIDEFLSSNMSVVDYEEVEAFDVKGIAIPVRMRGVKLLSERKNSGWAIFLRDLRPWKKLEKDKLDAERLGAVGQTVAGLAHTIKNMLMGLEGGMYMVDTGLRNGDVERIVSGWETLQRNFEKTTSLVKDFLSFAKGRMPSLRMTDPNELAKSIVELYRDTAARQGVELILESAANVAPAPLDPEGIETCLTNLVSNGIDAAVMRSEPGGKVEIRTMQDETNLVFEVQDNGGGMDWEVKAKVFTTFFTTKGGKGTGLGLLTTRKIIMEHGGRIEVDSDPGKDTIFRIILPLARLRALSAESGATAADNTGISNDK